MKEQLLILGFLLILAGFLIVLFSSSASSSGNQHSQTKVAIGGFIGPIPFGFFNDNRMIIPLVILMLIALLFFFFSRFFL